MPKIFLDASEVPAGWKEIDLNEVNRRFGSYGNFPINDRHQIKITEDGIWHFLVKEEK